MASGDTGKSLPDGRDICDAILHTLDRNLFELPRRTIVPSAYYVVLHPDTFRRIRPLIGFIREDAIKELTRRLGELNAKPFGRAARRHERAGVEWRVELVADSDGDIEAGDIEVHPQFELTGENEPIEGNPTSVLRGAAKPRPAVFRNPSQGTSRAPMATITYRDALGEQQFRVTCDEVSIGRGGVTAPERLGLEGNEVLSRKHCVLRRREDGSFELTDTSVNGTSINGRKLGPDNVAVLADGAKIELGGAVKMVFRLEKGG